MLALLATTPGRSWSRAALQDKLWSDRGQQQGRYSLRQALMTLRSVFEDDPGALILKGNQVELDRDRFVIDLHLSPAADAREELLAREFLEGIDIRDPEFEDWLREMRSVLRSRRAAAPRRPVPAGSAPASGRLVLALLPSVVAAPSEDVSLIADLIVDRFAIVLRDLGVVDLVDFRDQANVSTDRGADLSLRIRALQIGPDLSLNFAVHEVASRRLMWAEKQVVRKDVFGVEEIAEMVATLVDRFSQSIFRPGRLSAPEDRLAAKHAMDAIDCMFRLNTPNIDRAATSLRTAIEVDPRSPYLALYAYLTIFRCEASKGRNNIALRERADDLAARALERDPVNPITRSLLTHLYSFLFRDFRRAEELIRPLHSSPPDTPFYFHSLATLRFYTGRLNEARDAALRSAEYGRYNPYGYAFSTAICMVETVSGNLENAIRYGENVLSMHRHHTVYYEPALRYLGAAYGLSKDRQNGRRIVGLLKQQSPDFSLASLEDPEYPVPSAASRAVLKKGMSMISDV